MWLIDSTFHEGREQTHGFGATRDDAIEAFTRCWFQSPTPEVRLSRLRGACRMMSAQQ
jgi:hypothetical protein